MPSGERGGNYVTTQSGRRVYVGQHQLQRSSRGGMFYTTAAGRRVYVGNVDGGAGQPTGAQAVRHEAPHPEPVRSHTISADHPGARHPLITTASMSNLQDIVDRRQPPASANVDPLLKRGYIEAKPRASEGDTGPPRYRLTQAYSEAMRLRTEANAATSAARSRYAPEDVAGTVALHRDAAAANDLASSAYSALGRTDRAGEHGRIAEEHRITAARMTGDAQPARPSGRAAAPASPSSPRGIQLRNPLTLTQDQEREEVHAGYGRFHRTASLGALVGTLRQQIIQSNGAMTHEEALERLRLRNFRAADRERIVRAAFTGIPAPRSAGTPAPEIAPRPARPFTPAAATQGYSPPANPNQASLDAAAEKINSTWRDGAKIGHLRMARTNLDRGQRSMTLHTELYNGQNAVGSMQRRFTLDPDGTWSVYHAYFRIDRSEQRHGVAANMMKQADDLYRQIGVKEVRVTANLDVGGYTWALMGFDFANEYERDNTVERILRNSPTPPGETLPQRQAREGEVRSKLRTAFDCATYKVNGEKIGKKAMLGTSWSGVRRLADGDPTYEIGKNYYENKLAHADKAKQRLTRLKRYYADKDAGRFA